MQVHLPKRMQRFLVQFTFCLGPAGLMALSRGLFQRRERHLWLGQRFGGLSALAHWWKQTWHCRSVQIMLSMIWMVETGVGIGVNFRGGKGGVG